MITIYQYTPGWTVPCVSPFVCKVMYYMTMTGVAWRAERQDLGRLDVDTPHGQLPVIDDAGTRVADSTAIIEHLRATRGDVLDADASAADRAQMRAFTRMLDEHTYWVAVVQPRWRETAHFERYLRIIAGVDQVPDGLRAFADDFRFRVLNRFMNGGWGRLDAATLYARARADIDALADFLGDKPFFMGARPRSIDAGVLCMLRQVIDAPFDTDVKRHAAGKPNLLAYMARMNARYGI